MGEGLKSWSERGRPALFQALEAACRQIDRDMYTELKEKDGDFKGMSESMLAQVQEADSLRKQNESLRAELFKLRYPNERMEPLTGVHGTVNRLPERQPLGELSPNKATGSGPAILLPGQKQPAAPSKLQQDYDKLAAKYTSVLQAREQERAALKKRREDCKKWASYCDSLETKIKKLEKELEAVGHRRLANSHSSSGRGPLPPKPALVGQTGSEHGSPGPSPNASFNTSGAPVVKSLRQGPLALERSVLSAAATSKPERNEDILGQDSTDDGTQEDGNLPPQPVQQLGSGPVVIKEEPSSDGPVIVSERPVRKRKRETIDANNDIGNARVKFEASSSDPVWVEELQQFSPHESIDLDEAGQDHLTPKKRRSTVEPLTNEKGIDEDLLNLRASKRKPLSSSVVSHVSLYNNLIHPATYRPSISHQDSHAAERRSHRQLDQGVKDLAEDDDGLGTSNMAPATLGKSGRLDALLNTPCPDKGPVINRPTRQRQPLVRPAPLEFETPQPRSLPFSRNQGLQTFQTPLSARSPQQQSRSFDSIKRTSKSAATPLSRLDVTKSATEIGKSTPLRQLPPSRLSLTDFKINPKFNDGLDFAFSEVVRNKAERKNLMGCVDPECCGKTFRALAMLERESIGPSVMVRAEDIKLLEEFLGANAYRLGSMSREEKEELWLEAKMRELANKHGKHRERYTRRSSPPGFWNTDFPNTQEQQKERQEAAQQEQRLVEERYRDAMRGNGRWLFRDE